MVLVT
jgi:hypothetical protein